MSKPVATPISAGLVLQPPESVETGVGTPETGEANTLSLVAFVRPAHLS